MNIKTSTEKTEGIKEGNNKSKTSELTGHHEEPQGRSIQCLYFIQEVVLETIKTEFSIPHRHRFTEIRGLALHNMFGVRTITGRPL